MSGNVTALLAMLFVVILPLAILATNEYEERLRQRESKLREPVRIVHVWLLPPVAAWLLLVVLLGRESDSILASLLATWAVLAAIAAVLALVRIVIERVKARRDPQGRQSIPQLLLALPRLIVFLVGGWFLIAGVWDVDLSAALTALGVTSLVVSFALQDTLSGLASGVLLLGDQPFQTGDWIAVGEVEGRVVDINWRTSRIRTRNGDVIVVPNSELASSQILNFTDEQPLHRIVFPVQIAFSNAPSLAKDMLLDAARSTPGVLTEPAPQALVVQVDDPLMGYEVHMWVADYAIVPRVQSDFGSLVWYQSHRHNVPLPSPAQDLYLWDGPTAGIDESASPDNTRAALARSPLLAILPEDELDRLAHAGRSARFAAGEVIVRSDSDRRVVVLLDHGEADLCVLMPGVAGSDESDQMVVATLNDGDVIDQLAGVSVGGDPVVVRADTDCDVLLVEAGVAGEVGSRHPELATAISRTTTTWRRRIERLRERREQQLALAATDRLLDDDADSWSAARDTDAAESSGAELRGPPAPNPDVAPDGDGGDGRT